MGRDSDIRWRPARAESPWLVGAGLVLAVLGVLVGKWHGPSPVLLALGVVAAIGGVVLEWRKRLASRSDAQAATLDTASRALGPTGGFRTVGGTAREDFRVHRGDIELPYLRRDRHQDLHDRLVEGKPVLVVGHSMAGKTRMTYEVVRELYRDWPVWIPERPDGLATLLPAATPEQVVVWLDDLESYLTAAQQLRLSWLDALERNDCRVVATIRASEYEKFQPTGEVRPPQWEVLERFAIVRLEEDPDEQSRLADGVDDASTAAGIRRYGIGEYLGGGYFALDRFNIGKATHPLGVAMLRAAAHWRLLGFEQIPESMLLELSPHYLPERLRNASGEQPQAELDWASEEVGGRIRLLEPADGGWRVFDYLLDHLATQSYSIPDFLWETAIMETDDAERALSLGFRAYGYGQVEWAKAAWQRVIESADPALASRGAFNLGLLCEKLGDLEGSIQAYQTAINLGDPDAAPRAAFNLGLLHTQQSDMSAAMQAYQQAISSGHPDQAPKAAFHLGLLHKQQGDMNEAMRAYELAIDSSHQDLAPRAALYLGLLHEQLGDMNEAIRAYQFAINSNHLQHKGQAALYLGVIHQQRGELDAAAHAYQLAIEANHPDATPIALTNLAAIHHGNGEFDAAAHAYRLVIDSGHPDAAPVAALGLGVLYTQRDEVDAAVRAYQIAIDSHHSGVAPIAAQALTQLRSEQGSQP